MQAVRDMLIGFGFDMGHYHQETFTAPVLTPADAPVLDDVVPSAEAASEIVFAVSGQTVQCTVCPLSAKTISEDARASGTTSSSTGASAGVSTGAVKVSWW